jgi:adenosine deaminase
MVEPPAWGAPRAAVPPGVHTVAPSSTRITTPPPPDREAWKAVSRLFREVPKTELHEHLGGGTPLPLIEKMAAERGLSAPQRQAMVALIKPTPTKYADLREFLGAYGGVVGPSLRTPADFQRAADALVRQAGRENVRYLEVRERANLPSYAPEEVVHAIEAGLKSGTRWVEEHRGYRIGTGVIIAAVRNDSPKMTLDAAKLTVELAKRPGSLVRGFDLAGGEADHAVTEHAAALKYMVDHGKPLGLGITVHAGETPHSGDLSGLGSISAALDAGADRIGHGLQLGIQLEKGGSPEAARIVQRMRESDTHIELNPWSNYKIGDSVKTLKSYPLGTYLKAGLNVSLSTDDPTFFTRSQEPREQQLYKLWASGVLTNWKDLKKLTVNGIRSSFAPEADQKALEGQVNSDFRRIERDPEFRKTIDTYLSH